MTYPYRGVPHHEEEDLEEGLKAIGRTIPHLILALLAGWWFGSVLVTVVSFGALFGVSRWYKRTYTR